MADLEQKKREKDGPETPGSWNEGGARVVGVPRRAMEARKVEKRESGLRQRQEPQGRAARFLPEHDLKLALWPPHSSSSTWLPTTPTKPARGSLGCRDSGYQNTGRKEPQGRTEPRESASFWQIPPHQHVDLREHRSYHSKEKRRGLTSTKNPCDADSTALLIMATTHSRTLWVLTDS